MCATDSSRDVRRLYLTFLLEGILKDSIKGNDVMLQGDDRGARRRIDG